MRAKRTPPSATSALTAVPSFASDPRGNAALAALAAQEAPEHTSAPASDANVPNLFGEPTTERPPPSTDHGADLGAMSPDEAAAAQADRVAAQQELAGDFEIVPNDFVGPRLPNQVTQEEFDRVAVLYSDIRSGHSNIQFDSRGSDMTEEAFQAAVLDDMRTMLGTSQGRGLIEDVAYQQVDGDDRTTTIAWADDPERAGVGPSSGSRTVDTVDGTGAHTYLRYQPGVDLDLDRGTEWDEVPSDVVLFHEMVHADRAGQGESAGEVDEHGHVDFPEVGKSAESRADADVPLEEYETVGLGGHGGEFTENKYRGERSVLEEEKLKRRDTYEGTGLRPS